MTDRLEGKMAVVVGAGQTPGETIGNGRATALLFARQGATVHTSPPRLCAGIGNAAKRSECLSGPGFQAHGE